MPDRPLITLTTDFGQGPFPGLMKGVMLGICPQANLVDLSHAVPAQDVRAGALILEQAFTVFAPGTVHLAVVDPGVGGARRPVCVKALDMFFVGPDNGVFTPALLADPHAETRLLSNQALFRLPVSNTFHGRDIFAPVAAHMAAGHDYDRLGPVVEAPLFLDWPLPETGGKELRGVVLGADSFGNLYTNLPRTLVEKFLADREAVVEIPGLTVNGICSSYSEAKTGQAMALFNSLDRLELALNRADLRAFLGWDETECFGRPVRLTAVGR